MRETPKVNIQHSKTCETKGRISKIELKRLLKGFKKRKKMLTKSKRRRSRKSKQSKKSKSFVKKMWLKTSNVKKIINSSTSSNWPKKSYRRRNELIWSKCSKIESRKCATIKDHPMKEHSRSATSR